MQPPAYTVCQDDSGETNCKHKTKQEAKGVARIPKEDKNERAYRVRNTVNLNKEQASQQRSPHNIARDVILFPHQVSARLEAIATPETKAPGPPAYPVAVDDDVCAEMAATHSLRVEERHLVSLYCVYRLFFLLFFFFFCVFVFAFRLVCLQALLFELERLGADSWQWMILAGTKNAQNHDKIVIRFALR
ncbi:hypothetical protein VTK73DRAFT_2055 [Phialemonium thermophilum]|uniref:Uncharacterized protein n=1 Tax=Phialemonium thermophilum TaxID=223376 RepID=A0ABR3X6Z5_9PEZI